ncbi:MAG: 16S rRNA (cytosine(1402)-N(4))-methyltransferase RsmH [Alphaproteobacteria bacterium]|nr:16S rRNA (cytosine(1402)-N(4))-methyltransferase RsmH [Alphaproteobacteria bacterium]
MAGDDSRSGAGVGRGAPSHIPVLLSEVIEALAPDDGDRIIDATFGGGGYTRAILEAADVNVIAFDRDPTAARAAEVMADEYTGRFIFHAAPFSTMADHVSDPVDAIVLDIGVSSMQIDDPARGFSFQADGPLDMRMSAAHGEDLEGVPTAADLVNTLEEEILANLIYQLGDERRSRAIARAICRRRETIPFTTTADLAEVVARAYGRPPKDGRNPATRTFQALRIAVNDELGELARALFAAESLLKPGGRLAVVTFHSLEDRLVKRFFARRSGKKTGVSRHLPELEQFDRSTFQILNQRPLAPGNQEVARNPRARSAKLRWGIRTEADAPSADYAALGLPDWDRR